MKKSDARRLLAELDEEIQDLEFALFEADEGDTLQLDPNGARKRIPSLAQTIGDRLTSLAQLGSPADSLSSEAARIAGGLRTEPSSIIEIATAHDDHPVEEDYEYPLVARRLVARIRSLWGLQSNPSQHLAPKVIDQVKIISRNVGRTIEHLILKKFVSAPLDEHDVKHVLFSVIRALHPSALPDGSISFEDTLKNHKPDMGVPDKGICIETKVARSKADLSTAIDGLLGDHGNYGSAEYNTFIGVIYTNNDELTQEIVDAAYQARCKRLSADPVHEWSIVLAHGPLAEKGAKLALNKARAK
ncbi:hypothetical protein ABDK56_08310 [Sphingomonas sp. ASV193]|uniref:hypothetical protein n=1 Tax=Sphingomonas sp. ASV193 TaxID=3144405 RepID=UPI0032E90ACA